jgi:hypothetical protein
MVIIFLLVVLLFNSPSECDGYTSRNPLATHLSLPDNVSEPNNLPPMPYYVTPNETNTVTSYIYNTVDNSTPTIYAYNTEPSTHESYLNNAMDNAMDNAVRNNAVGNVRDMYGVYGGTFAGAQSEGFYNRLPTIAEQVPQKYINLYDTLHFSKHPVKQYPSKPNMVYLPQINTPIEPGWKF